MSDKNEPNNMLTIDLSEQSILFLNNALKYMYGKMQTNAQECFSLAEKMFEMYGDFDYSTGIETIEEPLSKIISKTNIISTNGVVLMVPITSSSLSSELTIMPMVDVLFYLFTTFL